MKVNSGSSPDDVRREALKILAKTGLMDSGEIAHYLNPGDRYLRSRMGANLAKLRRQKLVTQNMKTKKWEATAAGAAMATAFMIADGETTSSQYQWVIKSISLSDYGLDTSHVADENWEIINIENGVVHFKALVEV